MADARPTAHRRIRPAGWAVILLLVGGAGYAAHRYIPRQKFRSFAHRIASHARSLTAPEPPSPSGPPIVVAAPAAGLAPLLALPPALPPPSAQLPVLAMPPMAGLASPPNAMAAGGEAEALYAVTTGRAPAALISVAALAAHPEATAAGVRVVWLFGFRRFDGALLPSCAPSALRATQLGAVRGSLGHFHLLAALAGGSLPPLVLAGDDSALEKARAEGKVTGGEAPPSARATADMKDCGALPERAFAFVVVEGAGKPLFPADLAAIMSVGTDHPTAAEVATFFEPGAHGIGTFAGLYTAALATWTQLGLVTLTPSAEGIVDRRFIDPPGLGSRQHQAVSTVSPDSAPMRTPGYHSWPDG